MRCFSEYQVLTEVYGKRRRKSWTGPINYPPMEIKFIVKNFTKRRGSVDGPAEQEPFVFVGGTEAKIERSGEGETFIEGARGQYVQNQ